MGVSMVKKGLRQLKREQTLERITDIALTLFLEKGFDKVTIDEIVAQAQVSRQSFFDYFGSKENVVYAWQLKFGDALTEAFAGCPLGEPIRRTAERAMIRCILSTTNEQSLAIAKLIMATPALRDREQLLLLKLEDVLTTALMARYPEIEALEVQIVAMATIGAFRVGCIIRNGAPVLPIAEASIARVFRKLWREDGTIGS